MYHCTTTHAEGHYAFPNFLFHEDINSNEGTNGANPQRIQCGIMKIEPVPVATLQLSEFAHQKLLED